MTYQDFVRLYHAAADSADLDAYLADEGGTVDEWEMLPDIWTVAHSGFRALHDLTSKSLAALSREYLIPVRTLEDWSSGTRKPPSYVLTLLTYAVICGK